MKNTLDKTESKYQRVREGGGGAGKEGELKNIMDRTVKENNNWGENNR